MAARVIVAIEEDVVPAYDLPSNKIKAGKAPQGFISENERRISTRVHRSTAHTPQPPNTKIQKFLKLSSKGTPKNI